MSKALLKELDKRFNFVFDPQTAHFDGIYLTATLLNPSYRRLLDDTLATCAKKFLKMMIRSDSTESGDWHSQYNTFTSQQPPDDVPKPPKRFKHLNLVSDLLEKENTEEIILSKEDDEIERYLSSKPTPEQMDQDPLEYWISMRLTYPLIYPIACCLHLLQRLLLNVFSHVVEKLPKDKGTD